MDSEIAFSGNSQSLAHVTQLHAAAPETYQTMDKTVTQQDPASHAASGVDQLTQAMEALGRDSYSSPAQHFHYPENYTIQPRISELLVDFLNHFTSDEQVKFLISVSCGPSSTVQSDFLVGLTPGQQARFLILSETDRKILLMPAIGDGKKQHVIQEFVREGTTKV